MIAIKKLVVKRSVEGKRTFTLKAETEFEDHKKYLLTGDNGSGKSTLFCALENTIAFQGKILFDGEEYDERIAETIFSFRSVSLPHMLKTEEYLDLLGLGDEAKESFLILTELKLYSKTLIKKLSPSQCDRLKLANLLVKEYRYILIDEATRDLSSDQAKNLVSFLLTVNLEATLLIADHHIAEIDQHFDSVILIFSGVLTVAKEHTRAKLEPTPPYFLTSKSTKKKNHLSVAIKHRLRSFYPLYICTFLFILAFDCLAFASSTLPYQKAEVTSNFLGLTNRQEKLKPLNGVHNSAEEAFFPELFLKDEGREKVMISSGLHYIEDGNKIAFYKSKKATLIYPFDSLGKTLISGRFPRAEDEVAISSDLRATVEDHGEVILQPVDNGDIITCKVTGYLRGKNTAAISTASRQHKIITDYALNTGLNCLLPDGQKLEVKLTGEYEKKAYIRSDDQALLDSVAHSSIRFNDEKYGSDFTLDHTQIDLHLNDYHDTGVYVSASLYAELLYRLRGDYERTLVYDSFADLQRDKKMLIEQGYTVHSSFADGQDHSATIYMQVICVLVYGLSCAAFFALYYRRKAEKMEKIPTRFSLQKFDRLCFFFAFIILALPLAIVPPIWGATYLELIFIYLSLGIAAIAFLTAELVGKRVER